MILFLCDLWSAMTNFYYVRAILKSLIFDCIISDIFVLPFISEPNAIYSFRLLTQTSTSLNVSWEFEEADVNFTLSGTDGSLSPNITNSSDADGKRIYNGEITGLRPASEYLFSMEACAYNLCGQSSENVTMRTCKYKVKR